MTSGITLQAQLTDIAKKDRHNVKLQYNIDGVTCHKLSVARDGNIT